MALLSAVTEAATAGLPSTGDEGNDESDEDEDEDEDEGCTYAADDDDDLRQATRGGDGAFEDAMKLVRETQAANKKTSKELADQTRRINRTTGEMAALGNQFQASSEEIREGIRREEIRAAPAPALVSPAHERDPNHIDSIMEMMQGLMDEQAGWAQGVDDSLLELQNEDRRLADELSAMETRNRLRVEGILADLHRVSLFFRFTLSVCYVRLTSFLLPPPSSLPGLPSLFMQVRQDVAENSHRLGVQEVHNRELERIIAENARIAAQTAAQTAGLVARLATIQAENDEADEADETKDADDDDGDLKPAAKDADEADKKPPAK